MQTATSTYLHFDVNYNSITSYGTDLGLKFCNMCYFVRVAVGCLSFIKITSVINTIGL